MPRFFKHPIILLLALTLPCPALADVQPLIDNLNALPMVERDAVVLRGAKRRGTIDWDTTMHVHYTRELSKILGRRHPYLDLEIRRDRDLLRPGEALVNRLVREYKTGRFVPSVISAPAFFVTRLRQAGIIVKNSAPFRQALRPGLIDQDGWINPVYAGVYTLLYNTEKVKAEELPRSYEDLLTPRWQGRIAIDDEDALWPAALVDAMGQEKALDFVKRLAAQRPLLRRNPAHLIASGEAQIFPAELLHLATALKKTGAPVETQFLDPVLVQTSTAIWVAKKAPDPHVALLFSDYLLSQEAQTMFSRFGLLPARKELKIPYGLEEKKLYFLSPHWASEKLKELSESYRRILKPTP